MSFKADKTPPFLSFVLLTLILSAGIFAGSSIVRFPSASNFWWLLPVGLLSFGLARFLSRFNSWYLFLALPLAAGLAYAVTDRIWPRSTTIVDRVVLDEPSANLVETPLVVSDSHDVKTLKNKYLYAPENVHVSVFVSGLDSPRMLAVSPGGVLYASLSKAGRVVALPDRNRDGLADKVHIFADNLDRPHGLAFQGDTLIVAETGGLVRLTDSNDDLKADRREQISKDLPEGGGHWTRSLAIGPDNQLYVSVGSSCNRCLEEDVRRATVMRFSPNGENGEIFAYGLRNSVGLAWHPQTGQLWGSDNGRDMLGDDMPPDEINLIERSGDYGWPYCFGQKTPDPDLGSPDRCRQTVASSVDLQAHSAPLGISFGTDFKAPSTYQDSLFVAYHGSWNRNVPTGYKLVRIPFENGAPSGPPEDFISGWLDRDSAWGRPVAPLVGSDGALYLSDDQAGVVYRISYEQQETSSL